MPYQGQISRQLIRVPVSPLDKSTIVSIYPKPIHETHHTISPGVFDIPAGTHDNPATLIIGASSWFRDFDPEQSPIEIPDSSVTVAKAVVQGYASGLIGCDMGSKMIGLFYVLGSKSVKEIKTEHKVALDEAHEKQNNWFKELIAMTDSLWARSDQNPRVVSNDAILACNELQEHRNWLNAFATTKKNNCPACRTLIAQDVIVCPNCKIIIDPKKFAELKLTFAS